MAVAKATYYPKEIMINSATGKFIRVYRDAPVATEKYVTIGGYLVIFTEPVIMDNVAVLFHSGLPYLPKKC